MIWLLLVLIAAIVALPFVLESRRKPMDAQARKQMPGQLADLPLGKTHYRWIGPNRGPIAVCVHGLTTPSFVWEHLAEGLAGMGYRVLIYDLYGRGYSDRPDGEQNRRFFLNQLEALLENQEIKGDFTLIGYSMGGAIATCYASAHPDRVRQLILLTPGGLGDTAGQLVHFMQRTPVIGDWLMLALFPRTHASYIAKERKAHDANAGVYDLQLRELDYRGFVPAVLSSMRGILSENLFADHTKLHHEGVPVLAIWGRDDNTVPLSAMGRMVEASRSTKHEVVDDAGHGLPYTHADRVLAAVSESLREGLT